MGRLTGCVDKVCCRVRQTILPAKEKGPWPTASITLFHPVPPLSSVERSVPSGQGKNRRG